MTGGGGEGLDKALLPVARALGIVLAILAALSIGLGMLEALVAVFV